VPQFFIDQEFDVASQVELRGSDAKHIVQVLRLSAGDWLVLSDGSGKSYEAEILEASKRSVVAQIKSLRSERKISDLTLAIAITKHDKTEAVIQKSVELGIARIIPFHSERTVPRLVEDLTDKKMERWQKIAMEAAKQSGLPFRPSIGRIISFNEMLRIMPRFVASILFWEGENQRGIADYKDLLAQDGKKLIIIGPEGGFSKEEVENAHAAEIVTASLGQQILRVETAAIAALSICQYESGEFGV